MRNKVINSFIFLVGVFSLTSCLKGDPINLDPSRSNNVIEFNNTGSIVSGVNAAYHRFACDLGTMDAGGTATFNVNVNYAGADVAPEDITVTLAVDEAALTEYNETDEGNFVMPPADIYSFPSSVVIKKGTHQTTVQVTITNNASFDFNVNYALPLKIASVSSGVISGNFGTAIYSFAARNKYDGIYTDEVLSFTDYTLGAAAVATTPKTLYLITYGATSVAYFDPNLNGGLYGFTFKNNGAGSYYGNFAPIFNFDEAGNITAVTNYYGQGTNSSARACELNPEGVNKLTFNADGTPNVLEVSYFMTQGGALRLSIIEKMTYQSPR